MNIEEFAAYVIEHIINYLPPEYAESEISTKSVLKNNDMRLLGLNISLPGKNVCPTIYLNQPYQCLCEGVPLDTILKDIADVRKRNETEIGIDVHSISDLDSCRDKILPHLINRDLNEELLKDRPHRLIEDLAVTYHITYRNERLGDASIAVTNSLLDTWGINEEMLYSIALNNLSAQKSDLLPLGKMIAGMLKESDNDCSSEGFEDMNFPMFVLTNDSKFNGANAILNKTLMKKICKKFTEGFYILPSSIHEVILVPKIVKTTAKELKELVKDVNSTSVEQECILSDNVYTYSSELGLKLAV